MHTYIGLVRDHSGSMRSLASSAANDYNLTIDGIKQSILEENQTSTVTVVECGVGHRAEVRVVENDIPVTALKPLSSYHANGGATPLWDSVGEAITALEARAIYAPHDAAYLVMVITDGAENSSRMWNASKIAEKIRRLQATDKWTFVFRVPRGYASTITKLGIPAGNVMEWEQTEQALVHSSTATVSGTQAYFKARSAGQTSVNKFYADLASVNVSQVKQALIEVKPDAKMFVPPQEHGKMIQDFFNRYDTKPYAVGLGYYQLTKPETVQEQKRIVICDKVSGKYYAGASARQLLGLPAYGNIKLHPGSLGNYEVYVQSTSVNRKLVGGTHVLRMA